MKKTTAEFENRIEKAHSWEEMQHILHDLPPVTLRLRMEEICEKYHKTLPVAAELAGIPVSTFYAILNGDRPAHKVQFLRIAFALGLSLEELNELLKLAHLKELYAKNVEDAVIIFGMKEHLTPAEIDELLEQKKCTLRFHEYRD